MPKQTVRSLIPADDLPLPKQVLNFINFYCTGERDLEEAACRAGLLPEMGARLFRVPRVRETIQKRINRVDGEAMRLAAKAKALTVNLLDSSLVEEVKNKKNGHVRVRAIELGYKRTGMIRDGEFYIPPDPNTQGKNAPSIYQAGHVTVKRTVTEEVSQTMPIREPEPDIFAVQEY